jgi:hypothetical protein
MSEEEPRTIVRSAKTCGYAQIDNRALQDERLSWKATGLLAYLLSLPDDWKIKSADLVKRKTEGRDAVRSAMRELEAAGYMRREVGNGEGGRLETTWMVSECGMADAGLSGPGGSDAGSTDAGKGVPLPIHINKHTETKKQKKKEGPTKERKPKEPTALFTLMSAFTAGWRERYGRDYAWLKRNWAQLREVYETLGKDEAKATAVIGNFLADEDGFLAKNEHGFHLILSQLNRYTPREAQTDIPGARAGGREL